MTSSDCKKYYLRLSEYKNKNVKLKVMKNILNTKDSILQHKKRMLKEKYEELDNVNYDVWDTEDKFCNEMWNFSLEHNFAFFNQYPDIMENDKNHKCKYSSILNKDVKETDIQKETILAKLKYEIDVINNEITFICNKNTEQDIEKCKFTLNNFKLFTEEILEVLRLINTSENLLNISNISAHKVPNKCMNKEFISAKKLFKKSIFHTGIFVGKKMTTISNTVIERVPKIMVL
ncbi:uncharacterized protein LOC117601728 isoform X2 [Osmia lignaria lignaria]|uniref:uncharacterized protein LOC117601728 isoform X2 n=1 Tax=Osmia lignaria lignaria TaxID=1437193 RepID=UPI00402B5231